MRTLLKIAILNSVATSAFAQVADFAPVPEPGVLGLVGAGVLAYLIARRGKK